MRVKMRVVSKDELQERRRCEGSPGFVEEMMTYSNIFINIIGVSSSKTKYLRDERGWWWHPSWLRKGDLNMKEIDI